MSDAALVIPLALIASALALLWLTRTRRRALGVPEGETVYQDTRQDRGTLLVSARYGLVGRPDLLLLRGEAYLPVEVKTGRAPRQPYPSHVMQLVAYCALVEEHYGRRPAYGVIRYPGAQFEVEFTPQREAELVAVIKAIRRQRRSENVHRSHDNPRLCAGCGYRRECDEALAQQATI